MSEPLTKRQREVLDFLEQFIAGHAFAPSLTEISRALGLRSLATVHKHLEHLKVKGHIRRGWNRARHLSLVGVPGCCQMCGRPLDHEAKVETCSPMENGAKIA